MNKYCIIILLILFTACKKPFLKLSKKESNLSKEIIKPIKSIVFIAGYDEGYNTYYDNAKKYFKAKNIQVIDDYFSIAEIIKYLNTSDTKTYNKIHIVSHSNPWLGMSLKTNKEGERVTVESVFNAKKENKIPVLNHGIINDTKVIFHSCGLGENKALLEVLKQLFTTEKTPVVIASSFFNVFGGKYAGHYLAKPYYGYYPTAESPGPTALSKEFKTKYPAIKIDWFTALKTRKEVALGQVYSYKFNIPVNWVFSFDDKAEIPKLIDKDAIMDWVSESSEMATILYDLNIPIEKYRWKSKVKGNKLYIKGKTTVLCVLKPILQENDITEYKSTDFNNPSLYNIL